MRRGRPPFFPPYVNNLSDHFGICVSPGMPNYARADAMVIYRFLGHAHPIIVIPPRVVFDACARRRARASVHFTTSSIWSFPGPCPNPTRSLCSQVYKSIPTTLPRISFKKSTVNPSSLNNLNVPGNPIEANLNSVLPDARNQPTYPTYSTYFRCDWCDIYYVTAPQERNRSVALT